MYVSLTSPDPPVPPCPQHLSQYEVIAPCPPAPYGEDQQPQRIQQCEEYVLLPTPINGAPPEQV